MKEEWRIIKANDNYQVSNFGNVRRLYFNGTFHYLKPYMTDKGYLKVSLWRNGKKKNYFIHKLVANAFIDNPENLPQINHKNYIRTDNRVTNLEYCSASYNVRYSSAKPIIGYNGKMAIIFAAIIDV